MPRPTPRRLPPLPAVLVTQRHRIVSPHPFFSALPLASCCYSNLWTPPPTSPYHFHRAPCIFGQTPPPATRDTSTTCISLPTTTFYTFVIRDRRTPRVPRSVSVYHPSISSFGLKLLYFLSFIHRLILLVTSLSIETFWAIHDLFDILRRSHPFTTFTLYEYRRLTSVGARHAA